MNRRVVITGCGAVSPVGNTVESLWENLKNGKCGIDFIKKFDTADLKVKIAGEVRDFEPLDYIKKSELRKTDMFTQYGIAAAVQAMEDSGVKEHVDPTRLGVYMGSGIGGIHTFINECQKMETKGASRISPFFIPMMISNIAAGSIAIRYNAQGPCLPIVTACATGTHSIGEAYRNIKHGYADVIIAGGTEASISPLSVAGFTNLTALTTVNDPAQASIPFDQRRSGFVMGEGAGALILEDLDSALKRGAKIYGEIVGYGNTCDAYHITAPHPDAIGGTRAISLAMDEAKAGGIQFETSQIYVNAHGTSTPLNDKSETIAIKNALGDNISRTLVSSTKSMTGHMLGAAGAIEAIASILALRDGVIPPTIGYQVPDPNCDLDYVPNQKRKVQSDVALSISLGFGGHNACLAFAKYTGESAWN
ncbi:beta-ketoacyl-ACP synthase II [Acetobacterium woodii]|uniref:3-oxoacyl-[acyl-carrier-protein] synthase 2 n=1 Tax=Acetobacterium woodii (strain ATCC 29683 / DSM 1030 / JCM 2381 / KCTC 1655 / WB1) TaxID=931626 RepID=H6LJD2_ACEWD|nr:beta-ketoacyl-ACP synthase II [Acetobacterium woodii]AFA48695.1 3-oxoacyl-[acyl-carrier-protein] synthase FabF [Acetobacterium woodii DSM 1030]